MRLRHPWLLKNIEKSTYNPKDSACTPEKSNRAEATSKSDTPKIFSSHTPTATMTSANMGPPHTVLTDWIVILVFHQTVNLALE